MTTIFLLTTGDGDDGNEWDVVSIHSTYELAMAAKAKYELPIARPDGTSYSMSANIEEWPLDTGGE